MTTNIFTVRNLFCPHKDYSRFLVDKLTMFKLCNYEIVLKKISFMIILAYFIVYET
jgi:hypothetical protein